MNFQELSDSYHAAACVVSVEKTEDGSGRICIIAVNDRFLKSAPDFVPGQPYDTFLPKDASFEDVCFRAAVLRTPIHTYLHPYRLRQWLDVMAVPLEIEEGDLRYCVITAQICDLNDVEITSIQSVKTSTDVLKTCIKLHGTNDFRRTIDEVIKDIRLICGAEVCTLMLTDHGSGTCSVLAKSTAEYSRLKTVTQFVNFYDIADSWLDTVGDSDCIIIRSEHDMEYIKQVNNPWYLTLAEAGVNSVVLFPLRYGDEVLGFIWATNFDTAHTKRIKETLELTTFFLSSQIAGYKIMQRLEHISYTDILTGVLNRNAMNSRVSAAVSGERPVNAPFGVIFADLNGLKTVNDRLGHYAGDLLLKKAAIILQELFSGCEIYRAGGDEFVVLIQGCTEKELAERLAELKKRSSGTDGGVCFAAGSFYAAAECDLRDAMGCADEDMYRDKEEFYARHPERKKR